MCHERKKNMVLLLINNFPQKAILATTNTRFY